MHAVDAWYCYILICGSAAVSPRDFPPNRDGSDIYLLLNGNYVLSARPTQGCPPGEIGLTDAQRTWAQISLGPQDMVAVEPYNAFSQGGGAYLGALEVEVGFASRKTTETPYDQDELATLFKKVKHSRSQFWGQADRWAEFPESSPCPWSATSHGHQEYLSKTVNKDCSASQSRRETRH